MRDPRLVKNVYIPVNLTYLSDSGKNLRTLDMI